MAASYVVAPPRPEQPLTFHARAVLARIARDLETGYGGVKVVPPTHAELLAFWLAMQEWANVSVAALDGLTSSEAGLPTSSAGALSDASGHAGGD